MINSGVKRPRIGITASSRGWRLEATLEMAASAHNRAYHRHRHDRHVPGQDVNSFRLSLQSEVRRN